MQTMSRLGGFTVILLRHQSRSPLHPGMTNDLFRLGRGSDWSSKHPVL